MYAGRPHGSLWYFLVALQRCQSRGILYLRQVPAHSGQLGRKLLCVATQSFFLRELQSVVANRSQWRRTFQEFKDLWTIQRLEDVRHINSMGCAHKQALRSEEEALHKGEHGLRFTYLEVETIEAALRKFSSHGTINQNNSTASDKSSACP